MTKQKCNSQFQQYRFGTLQYLSWLFIGVGLLIPTRVIAAPFNSGSTGADGAFAPATNMVLTVPPGGTFNFTTVDIPVGLTVTFAPNVTNTPVTILTTGNVLINGVISVDGKDGMSTDGTGTFPLGTGGAGGPGGFAGGAGGLSPSWNAGEQLTPGLGHGPGAYPGFTGAFGCQASFGTGNPSGCSNILYGMTTLLPLIGGSGGGGGAASSSLSTPCGPNGCNGGGGGGGGGAIFIASSGSITINGTITANGGKAGNGYYSGGSGSGGGIKLIANTITGSGIISAKGGTFTRGGYDAGDGRIRLEANILTFSGTPTGALSFSTPGVVNFSSIPQLTITSVAGVAVPSSPGGFFESPDIMLPSSTTNPVTVGLSATNIPVNTIVKVLSIPKNGNLLSSANSTGLSGTTVSSTATASVQVSTTMPTILRAETTFAVQTVSADFPVFAEGEKVEKIRIAAAFGGPSEVFLITESGKEVRWR